MTRRPHTRHSRRVLGWAAGGFLAIQLAGGVILDYACPDVRFPLMRSMVEQAAAEPRPADVIILGSSRSDKSINATELTYAVRDAAGDADFRAFNGTIGWSDALTMELALNRLLAAGAAPRVVIVEMTPVTVARNTQWYVTHAQRQLRWGDLPTHMGEIVGSHRVGGLVHDRVAPLYEHRYEIVKRLRVETGVFPPAPAPYTPPADRPRPEMTEQKWKELLAPRPLTAEESARAGAAADGVRREVRDFGPTGNGLAALERTLETCHARGIRALIVGVPVSAAYRNACAPVDAAYREILAAVCARHGATFFDAHAALPDHLFSDYHHATPDGGVAFARLLARQAVAPMVKRQ